MKYLLTSAGIKNMSIHNTLVDHFLCAFLLAVDGNQS